jgi:tRNA (cytidine/uridine-2'-O-)-methyltransferase
MVAATNQTSLQLAGHRIRLALVWPQIAPNTGNVARLCVASGTELHLVRPMGFVLSDRALRRSAMDYWPRLKLVVHDDLEAFVAAMESSRLWLFSSKGTTGLWDANYADGDVLVFGNETHGLPESLVSKYADRVIRIPQAEGERCLNLSTAAGIALYQALGRLAKNSHQE